MSLVQNDLATVLRETFNARNQWANICLALGVTPATIDTIRSNNREDADNCYREGLSEWLKGRDRSWAQLVAALAGVTVRQEAIASKIEREYVPSASWRVEEPAQNGSQGGGSLDPTVQGTGTGRGYKVVAPRNNGKEEQENISSCLTLRQKRGVGIIVIVVFVAVVLLLPLVVFISLSVLSSEQSHLEETRLDGNTTVLISQRFNTQYYEKVIFSLRYGARQEPNVITCSFDCTNSDSEPQVHTALENHLSSSHQGPIPNRRYVQIRETQPVEELIYLLEKSSLLFTIKDVVQMPPVQLHILTSDRMCNAFYAGVTNSSFRNFSLNESNNFTANFTVPSAEIPRYYCGVWVIDSNASFDFTVQASIVTYDINFYQKRGECQQISPDTDFTLTIGLSLLEKYTCVLLAQLDHLESVDSAQVNVETNFPGPIFNLLIAFAIVIVLLIVLFLVFTCICLCCCAGRRCGVMDS